MSSILITGASHGVGSAFAVACAQSGRFSKIILNSGSDRAALEDTARRVSAAGDLVCAFDVGDVSDLKYVVTQNRRWDNHVEDLRPTTMQVNKLIFTHNRQLIFNAGKESVRLDREVSWLRSSTLSPFIW